MNTGLESHFNNSAYNNLFNINTDKIEIKNFTNNQLALLLNEQYLFFLCIKILSIMKENKLKFSNIIDCKENEFISKNMENIKTFFRNFQKFKIPEIYNMQRK